MNIRFTKNIQGHPFNFQPFNAGPVAGYHVDVEDNQGALHEFRMEQKPGGKWTMEGENLPAWIKQTEAELAKAIDQHG